MTGGLTGRPFCIREMSDEDRVIETPPAGAAGWREVWQERLGYRSSDGVLLGAVRKLVRRLMGPELDRQRDFNLATLDLLDGLRNDILSIRDDVVRDLARQDEKLSAGIQRNDALVTVLDQKIEGALARIRDLATPVLTSSAESSFRDDYLYRRFEDAARGSRDQIRESMRDLVPLLEGHAPLLDVGCGRGELLALCREAGIEARGIDVNERSVAELANEGYDVAVGAVPAALEPVPDGSLGAVYASHVVEHLPTSPFIALLTESYRVLRDGGVLVIETPNAQSLMMSGVEFWKDPSHLAPRHPASIIIIGRELGFEVATVETLHPFDRASRLTIGDDHPDDLLRLVDRLNEILFGDQDLRVVLRKS